MTDSKRNVRSSGEKMPYRKKGAHLVMRASVWGWEYGSEILSLEV